MLVVVAWLVWSLGILQVRNGSNLGFPIAISLTTLVIVMQAVEYLTRPKQIAYQKKQHTTRKSVR